MSEGFKRAFGQTRRTLSYVLIFKGAVGGSVAALALFGVTVPYLSHFFGVHIDTTAHQGVAAVVGAIAGIVLAAKA